MDWDYRSAAVTVNFSVADKAAQAHITAQRIFKSQIINSKSIDGWDKLTHKC